ncbi:acyltransferase [Permianibacter sp. IMCC34836]|uniref:acyltransferase n=1 Tax=Permianibacter fluminis TaxID=2738515 RepID=UPI0015570CB1|nr:acyltransferase [Permianibacter fluminis]NQD37409.1 acyltransferase [Permianibacter fluminis]
MLRLILKVRRLILGMIFTAFAKLRLGSYKADLRCFGFTVLTKNTHLGRNVNFNGMKIRGGGRVLIGDNFHSGSGCEIITQNHNYNGEKIPYDDTYIVRDVVIESNVWLGNRVMVLPGVRIGEGAIIQAGSVVVKDIPPCAIAGGHPAAVFSSRDVDHYNRLKGQGRFH